jgi:hypothetical protein
VLLLAISSACTYNLRVPTATGNSATALATQTDMRASVLLVSVTTAEALHNSVPAACTMACMMLSSLALPGTLADLPGSGSVAFNGKCSAAPSTLQYAIHSNMRTV